MEDSEPSEKPSGDQADRYQKLIEESNDIPTTIDKDGSEGAPDNIIEQVNNMNERSKMSNNFVTVLNGMHHYSIEKLSTAEFNRIPSVSKIELPVCVPSPI